MASYWTDLTLRRLGRRRALIAASGAAMGAAALSLVGCGGDSDDGERQEASGLFSAPVDSSSRAKRGGILQGATAELPTLDHLPAPSGGSSATAASHFYSSLIKFKTGVLEVPTGEIDGNFAESWEIAGDKMQITFKLRRDAKLDSRAPTNGRNLEAKDVIYSMNRFEKLSTFGPELFRSLGGLGPIESIQSPDAYTIIAKLAEPDSLTLQLLANARYLWIYPVESESGYDPRTEARGSGPWRLKSFEQSRGIEYERNPDWFGNKLSGTKDKPYLDGISLSFIEEYATLFAQFRAKNLWMGEFVRKEDVLGLKRDFPEMLLMAGIFPRSATRYSFGLEEPNTPFKDERVRQAVSMALDRDLIIDVFDNVDQLRAEGLPIETRWHSAIPAGWEGAWLDPKSKDFGENSKYYKFDQTEAKRLLTAAGYPNGFDYDHHYANNRYGQAYLNYVDIVAAALQEVGMRANRSGEDYSSVFLPGLRTNGIFTGTKMGSTSAQGDPVEMISNHYHSKGSFGQHQPPFQPEPDIDAMIDSIRKEFDHERQTQMIHDFQKIMAKRQRMLNHPGGSPAITVAWPWVGNYGAFQAFNGGTGTTENVHYWYDESKKT